MSSPRAAIFLIIISALTTSCLARPLVEASPKTSNVFVDQIEQTAVDKIDLLFMVDDSASMADKQEILQSAVPVLVNRLTSPLCIDPATRLPTGDNSVSGVCEHGEPEFEAVADIHVGIVTSSLGAHGGDQACADEHAHLLGSIRAAGKSTDPRQVFDASQTWNNSGFLAWDSNQKDQPVGIKDPATFQTSFQNMIQASGEQGCGFEASLESWYRFLVDPEPPAKVVRSSSLSSAQTVRGAKLTQHADGSTTCDGCDLELLAQRQAFLRPDSLVAIVMLSDENDCSIREEGSGWVVASLAPLPNSTSACAANPNDPCCRSCGQTEATPPLGCAPLGSDASCQETAPRTDGSPNLRCYEQRRRFGFDLLYPTSRYVDALSKPRLTLQSDGVTEVANPLFAASAKRAPRNPSLVFLAGIVGVPWQDIADDASLSGPGLKYLSADELVKRGRWQTLLGDPSASPPLPPTDPFMVESVAPRSGMNPITHDVIMPPGSTSPTASQINGHEQNVPHADDLQYACTFALATPRTCAAGDPACDCAPKLNGDLSQVTAAKSPLCQPPAGGAPTNVQHFAKAYPGTRELEVLMGMNEQGIAASICPKVTASADPASDPSYGYNPAVGAIIERLSVDLRGKCLPRALETDPTTHQALCQVIEAQPAPAAGCAECTIEGRGPASSSIKKSVLRKLRDAGECDGPGQAACASFCQCEIKQESGPDLDACRQNKSAPAGYCYIDDPALHALDNCPSNDKRLLRFVDGKTQKTPSNGAFAFVACVGAPLSSEQGEVGQGS